MSIFTLLSNAGFSRFKHAILPLFSFSVLVSDLACMYASGFCEQGLGSYFAMAVAVFLLAIVLMCLVIISRNAGADTPAKAAAEKVEASNSLPRRGSSYAPPEQTKEDEEDNGKGADSEVDEVCLERP